jgi:hypothetical protein
MKTTYTSTFKAQVVMELLKEEKCISHIVDEILCLSRSRRSFQPSAPSAGEVDAKHRIDELYLKFPSYGARRMAANCVVFRGGQKRCLQ